MHRSLRLATVAFGVGGAAFLILVLVVGLQSGQFAWSSDTAMYHRVGQEFAAGQPVYYLPTNRDQTFFYAPPFALLLGMLSWLPEAGLHLLTAIASIISLRIMAGSWLRAGMFCWFPIVAIEVAGGNFNLVIGAAVVLAVRGDARLASVLTLAKIAPILAIRPRDWRTVLVVFGLALLVTLPWLSLWPAWIGQLVEAVRHPFGAQVPIPFVLRLAVGLGLVATRRPALVALGSVVAIPAMYWGSLVMLLAPLGVWLQGRNTEPVAEEAPSGSLADAARRARDRFIPGRAARGLRGA
jgi:hypothetical protein